MINVVYSDGTFGSVSNRTISSSDKESDDQKIAKLYKLLSPHVELIQKQYPKVTKNSCGYRLDAVIKDEEFYPQKIFASSEGTLGIVTSAKLKIIDIPLYKATIVFGFKDLLSAMSTVPLVLQFSPVALEMLDHTVFSTAVDVNRPRFMDDDSGWWFAINCGICR
jgi:FAD/FMN-containing dehydrogenase